MRAIVHIQSRKVKKMAQRRTRLVGAHDQYIPHFAGLGWAELLEFWPDEDNRCYLVALDNRQISVLLSLLDQVAWAWWLWNISTDNETAGHAINDFTDELKDCLMSGCNVSDLVATVEDLTEAIKECCEKMAGRSTQDIDEPPHDGEVEVGPGEQFGDQDEYYDAKCSAANAIFDTIRNIAVKLDEEDILGLIDIGLGVTTSIFSLIILAGPAAWAIASVSGALVSMALAIVAHTLDFGDMTDALNDEHSSLVLALYNASNTATAKANFLTILAGASPTLATTEKAFVAVMLTDKLLTLLFAPRADIVEYTSPDPITCGTGGTVWTFDTSGQGWTFVDESVGTQEAAGLWISAREAWEIELTIVPGGGAYARGAIYLDGLSIAVDVGNSVQFDFSKTSDGLNSYQILTVTYSDLTWDSVHTSGSSSSAGTLILNISEAKTIEEIKVSASRETGNYHYYIDFEEVRVL